MTLPTYPAINPESYTYSTAENFLQPELQGAGSKGFWFWRKKMYRLVKDYWFEWGPVGARKRIFRRRGFEYDKASVPPIGAILGFTTDGEVDASSMVHDNTWRDKGTWTPGELEFQTQIHGDYGQWMLDTSRWTKMETNNLYKYMSELGGMPKWAMAVEVAALDLWPPNWFKGF